MPIIGKKRLSVDFNVRSTRDVRRRKENVSLIVKCSEPPSGSANASYEPAAAIVPHDESQTTNSRLRDAQEEHWCRVREEMTAVGLSLEFPHSFNCSACGIGVQFPIRCQDCSPAFICCVSCESKMHQQTLHKPELWKGSVFVPYYSVSQKLWTRKNHMCCSMRSERSMELIDSKGRDHHVQMQFCECEEYGSQLVRFGFWPSTPVRPTTAFSMELLRLLNILTLECSVSVAGMVQTLRWMNNLSSKQASHLYWLLIGESIAQFRYYDHRISTADMANDENVADVYKKKCPVCPQIGGITTVSMDANFGLVHKHHSGVSTLPPDVKNSYFVGSDEVQSFITEYQTDNEKDKECNNFLAGNAIRSRARNAKLDVRGVFGSVCRHEYPLLFMDMKHGERLAYPVMMMKKLLDGLSESTSFQAVYDIACILTRHLKKTNQVDLLEKVKLGLPVFHAYGHNASCQLDYSSRNLTSFGLTDGEGTERLWSYLRPLAKVTKEMTSSRRIDLLNYALNHFARRKTAGLAQWFEMRIRKADAILKDSQAKLCVLRTDYCVNNDEISKWHDSYKKHVCNKTARSISGTNKEKLLRQVHQCATERAYLVSLLSKYCDGQTVAQRISGQVRRATSELRKYVDAYNAETPENSLPSTVTFEETLDATSNVYLHLHSTLEINTSVPPPVKWNAINLMQLSKRAAEDQDRMLVDLQSAVDNFTDLHTCLLTASTNAKTPGLQSLINKQVLQLEGVMTGLWRVAGNHLVDFTAVQPKLLLESDQLDKHHSLDHDTNDDLDLNEIAFEENYCADDEEGSKDAIPEV